MQYAGKPRWLRIALLGAPQSGKSTLISQFQTAASTDLADTLVENACSDKLFIFTTANRHYVVATPVENQAGKLDLLSHPDEIDAAIIMADAASTDDAQTITLAYLVKQFGLRHIAVAVNKMDLPTHAGKTFEHVVGRLSHRLAHIGLESICYIPLAAKNGENVLDRSSRYPWYAGPTLLDFLETAAADLPQPAGKQPFRLRVQWLAHPEPGLRGIAGTIASGAISLGDRIRVQPSGKEGCVTHIFHDTNPQEQAGVGETVTLVLEPTHDISPGEVVSVQSAPAETADQFEVMLTWLSPEHLLPGRSYTFQAGPCKATATVTDIKYRVNTTTLDHIAAKTLDAGCVGVCNLSLDRLIAFDPYTENRTTGSFMLFDSASGNPAGGGLIHFALRRAHNIHIQHIDINKAARAAIKGQRACVLWFTGLSGSGKSTIANLVEKKLHAQGKHTYLLDGDNVRHGLNRDLGFTDADRVENIRRIAEVAKLMVDAGLIVLTAFISPFRAERQMARKLFTDGEFLEVFVDTPLAVAEERDPKGLYKKARRGELRNFTGIDSPYEMPEAPELALDTTMHNVEELANQVIEHILAV